MRAASLWNWPWSFQTGSWCSSAHSSEDIPIVSNPRTLSLAFRGDLRTSNGGAELY